MEILFSSASASNKKYNDLFNLRNKKIISSTQNFFRNILLGLSTINDIDIQCLTALPVSSSLSTKYIWKVEFDRENDNLSYCYLPFFNGKISRIPSLLFSSFFYTFKWAYKNKNKQAVCISDALNWVSSIPVRIICQFFNIKVIGFITDLPIYSEIKKENVNVFKKLIKSFISKVSLTNMRQYDAYVVVAKDINSVVNPNDKPYMVIESVVANDDDKFFTQVPHTVNKNNRLIFLYAGGIYEKYGLKNLVEAFLSDQVNAELHLYGDGDYADKLHLNNPDPSKIKYFGCIQPDLVKSVESQADILVNPRPVEDDYTRFSFPSKILEYMSTGRLVMSTRLRGIPNEYNDYIEWFDGDDVESLRNSILKIMKKPKSYIHNKGEKAKLFVYNEKNNIKIGMKMINFINKL